MNIGSVRSVCVAAAWLSLAAAQGWALEAAPTWKTPEKVSPTGHVDTVAWHTAADRILAFDHHGNPGVVVAGGTGGFDRPSYARSVFGIGWSVVTVGANGTKGAFPSLAFDRYERPTLSYINTDDNTLKYAAWTGTEWQVSDVATDAYMYSALAMDLYGRPAITYVNTSYDVAFVADSDGDGTWETSQTIYTGTAACPSLVFDSLNRPLVAFTNTVAKWLILATKDTGFMPWTWYRVDTQVDSCWYPSLALDPDTGYPAIAYLDTGSLSLKYAAWDGQAWDGQALGTAGRHPSLAFDPADGNPAIAYGTGTGGVKFVWHDGVAWQSQVVASSTDPVAVSLAFNDYGTGWPAIAYVDGDGTAWYVDDPPAVPEPTTMALLLGGAAAVLWKRRRMSTPSAV